MDRKLLIRTDDIDLYMESSGDMRSARLSAQTHLCFGVAGLRIFAPRLGSQGSRTDLLSVSSESEIGNGMTRGVLITPAHVTQIYI